MATDKKNTLITGTQITITIERPLDENPAAVFLASKASRHSQRAMQQGLDKIAWLMRSASLPGRNDNYRHFCFVFPWEQLRYQHTAAIRAKLMEAYKPATTNNMLSALRGVLKECWRLGYMDASEYHRAIDFQNIRDETLPAGRELNAGELIALFAICNSDRSPAGIRDGAILAVLRYGLRRAEVVGLTLADYETDSGKLLIRGKGRKERTVYLPGSANEYLINWVAVRNETNTNFTETDQPDSIPTNDALFCPINRGGNIQYKAMTSQSIYGMLRKRAAQAGVRDFSPHDFRRTFAGDMLDAGADIVTVANIMGHASVNTTARYDRRPDQAKIKAAELIHIPAPGTISR